MNSWNSDFIHSSFEKQSRGFITKVDGRTEIHHPQVGLEIRRLIEEEGAPDDSKDTIEQARVNALKSDTKHRPFQKPIFGYVAKWLSELGKKEELESLLDHFDTNCSPTWEKGGLYYPRNDQVLNEIGEWTFMDPFSGNAAIGYARLNIPNGQKLIWEKPWTKQSLAERPYVAGLHLAQGVDCLRGEWNADKRALIVTLKALETDVEGAWSVENLPEGRWGVYQGGKLVDERYVEVHKSLPFEFSLRASEEKDFVVMQAAK